MEGHENEMLRMEREAQRINAEEEIKMQQKLTELRNQLDNNINDAIEREKQQVVTPLTFLVFFFFCISAFFLHAF